MKAPYFFLTKAVYQLYKHFSRMLADADAFIKNHVHNSNYILSQSQRSIYNKLKLSFQVEIFKPSSWQYVNIVSCSQFVSYRHKKKERKKERKKKKRRRPAFNQSTVIMKHLEELYAESNEERGEKKEKRERLPLVVVMSQETKKKKILKMLGKHYHEGHQADPDISEPCPQSPQR